MVRSLPTVQCLPDDDIMEECISYWEPRTYSNLSVGAMRQMLEKRGYHVGKLKDQDKLRWQLQRSDQGLLSYLGRPNSELRALIRARDLETDFGPGNIGQRFELLEVLEEADQNPEFERFMDLPPELRARIYEYYFLSLKEPLLAPTQPPLTLTNRMIRQESLPLFYATCSFELRLRVHALVRGAARHGRRYCMPTEFHLWLHTCGAENLADIKNLVIKEVVGKRVERYVIIIDGSQTDPKLSVRVKAETPNAADADVIRRIRKVVKGIQSRDKGWKLNKEDFFDLRKAYEKV